MGSSSSIYDTCFKGIFPVSYNCTFELMPNGLSKSDIKQVIYNDPATIVYFKDGSKVVVKTMDGDEFNEEVGLAMAIMKKMFGSSTAFKKFVKKWKE